MSVFRDILDSDVREDYVSRLTHESEDFPALESWFSRMVRHDLLTHEEEIDIAKRVENGDESALDQMIRSNFRLVVLAGFGRSIVDCVCIVVNSRICKFCFI